MSELAVLIQELQHVIMVILGLPRTHARVLGALMVLHKPVGLKELSEVTGYSKSTVSTYLGILERMNLVSRVKTGGKLLFQAKKDLVSLFLERQQLILKEILEPAKARAQQLEGAVSRRILDQLNKLSELIKSTTSKAT